MGLGARTQPDRFFRALEFQFPFESAGVAMLSIVKAG